MLLSNNSGASCFSVTKCFSIWAFLAVWQADRMTNIPILKMEKQAAEDSFLYKEPFHFGHLGNVPLLTTDFHN